MSRTESKPQELCGRGCAAAMAATPGGPGGHRDGPRAAGGPAAAMAEIPGGCTASHAPQPEDPEELLINSKTKMYNKIKNRTPEDPGYMYSNLYIGGANRSGLYYRERNSVADAQARSSKISSEPDANFRRENLLEAFSTNSFSEKCCCRTEVACRDVESEDPASSI